MQQSYDIFGNNRYELHLGKRGGVKIWSLLSDKYLTKQLKSYVFLTKEKGGIPEPFSLEAIKSYCLSGTISNLLPMTEEELSQASQDSNEELKDLIESIPSNEELLLLPVDIEGKRELLLETGEISFTLYTPYKDCNGRVKAHFVARIEHGCRRVLYKRLESFDYEDEWHIKDLKKVSREEREHLLELLKESLN